MHMMLELKPTFLTLLSFSCFCFVLMLTLLFFYYFHLWKQLHLIIIVPPPLPNFLAKHVQSPLPCFNINFPYFFFTIVPINLIPPISNSHSIELFNSPFFLFLFSFSLFCTSDNYNWWYSISMTIIKVNSLFIFIFIYWGLPLIGSYRGIE